MEFERFFKFSQLLLRDKFFLSYSGYVSEDILETVEATLRQQLENHARDGRQIRNVSRADCSSILSPACRLLPEVACAELGTDAQMVAKRQNAKKRYLITVSISDRFILGQLGICTESTVAPVAHWPAKTPFCWHRTVPLGKR